MFRSWEVPTNQREQATLLDERYTALQNQASDNYFHGRVEMRELAALSEEDIAGPPTEKTLQEVRDISTSQSLGKVITYYSNLFASSPVHPLLASEIINSLTKKVAHTVEHQPVARNLRDLFVEIDALEDKEAVRDSFLHFVDVLISDPKQTCFSFINSHLFVSESQLATIRKAIKEKNVRRVTDNLAAFWQNRGEFADDDTIRDAYALWSDIGEKSSQDPLFPVPRLFQKAGDAFAHIMRNNEIQLKDRRIIAEFSLSVS